MLRTVRGKHDVVVACMATQQPVNWDHLVDWVEDLGQQYGQNLLRIKGTVSVADNGSRVFINGVQDVFYPPILLPKQHNQTEGSQLVLIGRGIDPVKVQSSFESSVLRRSTG